MATCKPKAPPVETVRSTMDNMPSLASLMRPLPVLRTLRPLGAFKSPSVDADAYSDPQTIMLSIDGNPVAFTVTWPVADARLIALAILVQCDALEGSAR